MAPLRPSGIRLGSPACVTRGMGEAELRVVAQWIVDTLRAPADVANRKRIAREVRDCALRFAVPGIEASSLD